ncbi:electron transport complex subunit E [Varunaivibrio sulfuroxidans]|uniref:Ion-translocating oxidoreductase complex subunit E n=1 Tax=Varunaivibrio sulfuroxidans TaxID=1773489 RepID=A0A4R3J8N2_9PROT|nr:electron transport complex subunit E [Varunaivibrio sulfuroxidans]TCS61725.1 electron transport complex protein RnfE [Varunaivibrio sulfuroxidans]WES32090.1 electron transport complex subunit E [Varunaivibrio sulfuroxidans]
MSAVSSVPSPWKITADGLWRNNIVFSQKLSLCPLMAVTAGATNGLGMGLATTAVLVVSNALIAALRPLITDEIRIPVFVLVIAALVSAVDMAMNAWVHTLYQVLGLFIPLIVTNCAIFGRAEAFAFRQPVWAAALDGLMMGLGMTLALVAVGFVREILGKGTLFANAATFLGQPFSFLQVTVIPHYSGFLLFVLPPGGFLALGFLLALKRALEGRRRQSDQAGCAPGAHAHGTA